MAILIEELKTDPGKNLTTLSTRVELYTQEQLWKDSSKHTKNMLYTFILHAIDVLQKKYQLWTRLRMNIAKTKDSNFLYEINNDISMLQYEQNYDEDSLKNLGLLQKNINWRFNPIIKTINSVVLNKDNYKIENQIVKPNDLRVVLKPLNLTDSKDLNSMMLPLYHITTRDSFAYDLIEKVTLISLHERKAVKKIGNFNSFYIKLVYFI